MLISIKNVKVLGTPEFKDLRYPLIMEVSPDNYRKFKKLNKYKFISSKNRKKI